MTPTGSSEREGFRLAHEVGLRLKLLGWLVCGTGTIVVFLAVGFLIPVFLGPGQQSELARENLPVVAASYLGFGVVMTYLMKRRLGQAFAWLREAREPTEREHRQTLRLPTEIAVATMSAWGVGGVLMGALNLDHSLAFAAIVTIAIWAGGDVTSGIALVTSERLLRPVTARALASEQPNRAEGPGIRMRLLYGWSLGTFVPLGGVVVIGVVAITKPNVQVEYLAGASIFLAALALLVSLFATMVWARSVADPVTSVRRAIERVGRGELEAEVPIDDASEIGLLQAGFNRMAEGLRERDRIRDLFGRQVGHDVARAALHNGTRLGGEEREVGALFVDLAGSTAMSLALPPTEVVRLLNRFFRIVVEAVEGEHGLVNKFEGDAALCVFGAPVSADDPAGDALKAARLLGERLEREVPDIGFGIGVSAGRAVAGNVGAEHRFEYTVIGDPVNEAARLSELAKERELCVVASETALRRASPDEAERWEVADRVVLRGRLDATPLATPRALTAGRA
jgi:adenylate cyclase